MNKLYKKKISKFLASHQLLMFENPIVGLDSLMELLHSNTYEVRKYAAKSIAYLSLRNGNVVLLFVANFGYIDYKC